MRVRMRRSVEHFADHFSGNALNGQVHCDAARRRQALGWDRSVDPSTSARAPGPNSFVKKRHHPARMRQCAVPTGAGTAQKGAGTAVLNPLPKLTV